MIAISLAFSRVLLGNYSIHPLFYGATLNPMQIILSQNKNVSVMQQF